MRVARLVGKMFVAILVVSAVTATAASAFPELKVLPLSPKFTFAAAVNFFYLPDTTFTCESAGATGELASMDSVGKVIMSYHNCLVIAGTCTAKLQTLTAK